MKLFNAPTLFFTTLGTPFFLNTNGSIFRGTSLDTNSFGLPLVLFVIIFYLFFNLKSLLISLFTKSSFLVLLFLFLSLGVFLIGAGIRGGFVNPLLLSVSVIPFFAAFLMTSINDADMNVNTLSNALKTGVYVCAFFSFLHTFSSILEFGILGSFVNRGSDSFFGLFSIYQKLVYYPTILSCFFCFGIFKMDNFKIKIAVLVIFITVVMVGSRESLLFCVLALFFKQLYSAYVSGNFFNAIFRIIGILFFIVMGGFIAPILIESFSEVTIVNKLIAINESGDYTAGRGNAIELVFNESKRDFNLFMGTGYSMSLGDFRTPHNQYLETFLRSGLFGMVLLILIILKVYVIGFKLLKQINFKKERSLMFSLLLTFLLLTLISFNVNTPLRAPYTAVLFGFILGCFYNYKSQIKEI